MISRGMVSAWQAAGLGGRHLQMVAQLDGGGVAAEAAAEGVCAGEHGTPLELQVAAVALLHPRDGREQWRRRQLPDQRLHGLGVDERR